MTQPNYKELYKDYMDFLDRDINDYATEEEYKDALKEELEAMIALNGSNSLFEREIEMCELLNIDLNN